MKNLAAPPLYSTGYSIMPVSNKKIKKENGTGMIHEMKSKPSAPVIKKQNITDSPLYWDEGWFGNYE